MAIQIDKHDGLTRTYSDTGHYIIQLENGAEYQEAWDPVDYPREYTESDRLIENDEPVEDTPEDDRAQDAALVRAAEIMLGGE